MPSRETTSSHASIGRLLLADYRGWSHQEEWGVARQGGGGSDRLGGHNSQAGWTQVTQLPGSTAWAQYPVQSQAMSSS